MAREGTPVFISGKESGKVSSGTFSPSLGKAIALAYINGGSEISTGTEVELVTERFRISGKTANVPFYKNGTARK